MFDFVFGFVFGLVGVWHLVWLLVWFGLTCLVWLRFVWFSVWFGLVSLVGSGCLSGCVSEYVGVCERLFTTI